VSSEVKRQLIAKLLTEVRALRGAVDQIGVDAGPPPVTFEALVGRLGQPLLCAITTRRGRAASARSLAAI